MKTNTEIKSIAEIIEHKPREDKYVVVVEICYDKNDPAYITAGVFENIKDAVELKLAIVEHAEKIKKLCPVKDYEAGKSSEEDARLYYDYERENEIFMNFQCCLTRVYRLNWTTDFLHDIYFKKN